jgi:hypothetical protein
MTDVPRQDVDSGPAPLISPLSSSISSVLTPKVSSPAACVSSRVLAFGLVMDLRRRRRGVWELTAEMSRVREGGEAVRMGSAGVGVDSLEMVCGDMEHLSVERSVRGSNASWSPCGLRGLLTTRRVGAPAVQHLAQSLPPIKQHTRSTIPSCSCCCPRAHPERAAAPTDLPLNNKRAHLSTLLLRPPDSTPHRFISYCCSNEEAAAHLSFLDVAASRGRRFKQVSGRQVGMISRGSRRGRT